MNFYQKQRSRVSQRLAEDRQSQLTTHAQLKEAQTLKSRFARQKERLKRTATQTAAWQWALVIFSAVMVIWAGVVTGIFLDFATTYIVTTVEKDREWYVVNVALASAQMQAARALADAQQARDAVCIALHSGLIGGSSAYAALERVLTPALLVSPFVYEVELALSDSPDVTRVRQLAGMISVRSNAADCFLLGVDGCFDAGTPPGNRPPWWFSSIKLPLYNATGYGGSSEVFGVKVGSEWDEAPELVATRLALDGTVSSFTPSYKLNFRCGGSLVVAGRVTVGLGSLSGNGKAGWFYDERLGEDGRIYLCDKNGFVLSSLSTWDLFVVKSGQLRFVRVWELAGVKWALQLQTAFDGGVMKDLQFADKDGTYVALRRLPAPLDHFATLVVAPSRAPFVNVPMFTALIFGAVVVCIPWLVGICLLIYIFCRQWRRNLQINRNELRRGITRSLPSFAE